MPVSFLISLDVIMNTDMLLGTGCMAALEAEKFLAEREEDERADDRES